MRPQFHRVGVKQWILSLRHYPNLAIDVKSPLADGVTISMNDTQSYPVMFPEFSGDGQSTGLQIRPRHQVQRISNQCNASAEITPDSGRALEHDRGHQDDSQRGHDEGIGAIERDAYDPH